MTFSVYPNLIHQVGDEFLQTYQRDTDRQTMSVPKIPVPESFEDIASLKAALQRMQELGLRIIVGILGPTDARRILCMVR